jgi:hypothetical protein
MNNVMKSPGIIKKAMRMKKRFSGTNMSVIEPRRALAMKASGAVILKRLILCVSMLRACLKK